MSSQPVFLYTVLPEIFTQMKCGWISITMVTYTEAFSVCVVLLADWRRQSSQVSFIWSYCYLGKKDKSTFTTSVTLAYNPMRKKWKVEADSQHIHSRQSPHHIFDAALVGLKISIYVTDEDLLFDLLRKTLGFWRPCFFHVKTKDMEYNEYICPCKKQDRRSPYFQCQGITDF